MHPKIRPKERILINRQGHQLKIEQLVSVSLKNLIFFLLSNSCASDLSCPNFWVESDEGARRHSRLTNLGAMQVLSGCRGGRWGHPEVTVMEGVWMETHGTHAHTHCTHLMQCWMLEVQWFYLRLCLHHTTQCTRVILTTRRICFVLLGLLAFLGATILKPYLNLSLRQRQCLCQFRLPADCDVFGCVIFFLQLQALEVCVHHAVFVLCPGLACKYKRKIILLQFFLVIFF